MIAVVSSKAGEGAVVRNLSEAHGWPCKECSSVRDMLRLLTRVVPKVIVVRQKLGDGFSDDILARVADGLAGSTKIIVLADASFTPVLEARQLSLGADCVLRDPVRSEVLRAYLAKYVASRVAPAMPLSARPKKFCRAVLDPTDWSMTFRGRSVQISPREMSLAELLSESDNVVVSYDRLYSTILNRTFAGASGNMRVLLALLQDSMRKLGIRLRDHVSVIPKSGYRYTHTPHRAAQRRAAARR